MPQPSPLRPSDEDLRRLYLDERLPASKIALRCKVEKITALRWLRAAGIERRPPGIGLAARGVTPPTAAELRELVHVEHLSYRQIAARYGVDPSAITHWLRAHDIPAPTVWETRLQGRIRREPDRRELSRRIEAGESLSSIARDFGVSRDLVRSRCQQYGIPIRRDGWLSGHRITCTDGHLARSTYEQRVDDWLSNHGIEHQVEPAYPWDRRYRADFLVGHTYVEVWGVTDNPAYAERKRMKIDRSRAEGLDLIGINHWQFATGRQWWRPLLRLRTPAD